MTDRSMHLQGLSTTGVWPQEEMELHITVLEMKPVQLTLNAFLLRILGGSVVLMSDSVTVEAHLKKQGACVTVQWHERKALN